MNKAEHALRFRRFQQSRENFFAPKINQELIKQYQTVIRFAPTFGISAVQMIDSGGIARVIRNLYMDAGIVYGAKIRADFAKIGAYKISMGKPLPTLKNTSGIKFTELKARAAIGFSAHMAQLIAEYFSVDVLNVSEGITQTTRDLIATVFNEAYREGLNINEIVDKLKDTELSRVRARLIARTETVTASNQSALFVANDTGLLYNKTWLATRDARTRNDHREVNGNQVGMNDYFNVGGFDMAAPGDHGGKNGKLPVPAKEICNCRCCVTMQAVRDAQGRLIRA